MRGDDKLIQLFDPPFDKGTLQPGYIKGYVPGIRENGGQYTHAATWVVLATALQGRGDRALELWNLINPVYHATTPEEVQHYKVEPYVVCADVYGAPPHTGRGGWTWYTGSASWLYRVAMETILGFHCGRQHSSLRAVHPTGLAGIRIELSPSVRDIPDSGGQLGRHGPRRPVGRARRPTIAEARSAAQRRPEDPQGPRGIGLTADGDHLTMADTP